MKQNSSEMDSHKCSQLIFEKGAEIFQWKRTVFSKNDVETTGYSDMKKKKSVHRSYIFHKNYLSVNHRPKC